MAPKYFGVDRQTISSTSALSATMVSGGATGTPSSFSTI